MPAQERLLDAGRTDSGSLCKMTEGQVTVFAPGPTKFGLNQPNYNPLRRLYCKNGGYHLRLLSNGAVDGSRQENDVYTTIKVRAVNAGVVVIIGHEAERYLAMDKHGQLYGTTTLTDECYFMERMEENHYNTYRSQKYKDLGDWYVGIKKSGQAKSGLRTHRGQNAVYFLPIPIT
ncbi:fibroblast growth factor 1b [Brachyhypopomus gauderio]|uniref:fibroblast growth factor 1b n=1 Tax=Brachyhypopomus gauderio TaxID=698409 RepID=UPI004042E4EA